MHVCTNVYPGRNARFGSIEGKLPSSYEKHSYQNLRKRAYICGKIVSLSYFLPYYSQHLMLCECLPPIPTMPPLSILLLSILIFVFLLLSHLKSTTGDLLLAQRCESHVL